MLKLCVPTQQEDEIMIHVESTAHPTMGSVFTLHNGTEQGKIKKIILPQNRIATSVIQSLREICTVYLQQQQKSPSQISPTPTFYSLFSEIPKDHHLLPISPQRLQDRVGDTVFCMEDLVFSIRNRVPFSTEITVPLHQVKLLLFFGFQDFPHLTPQQIETLLLKLNIQYDFSYTRLVLENLAHYGFVKNVDPVNDLWSFHSIPRKFLTAQGEVGGMVEVSWRIISVKSKSDGETLLLPLNKRTISLIEVLTKWGRMNKIIPKFRSTKKLLQLMRLRARIRSLELE